MLPQIASLADTRAVLRLSGQELVAFLQGLLTNDTKQLEAKDVRMQYAALLNSHGRYLHDLFLHKQKGDDLVLLADVDKHGATDLVKLLNRYKLRAKVDIADVSSEYTTWARFGPGLLPQGEWHSDPRLQALGQRIVLQAHDKPTTPEGEQETEGIQYKAWRIEQGVAEGDTEMPSGHAIPLEYNLDGLNAISFSKGCYVGQELIARSHFRGVIRKRLMPVNIAGDEEPKMGTSILAPGRKRPAGSLQAAQKGRGLACLNLQAALTAAEGNEHLELGEGGPQVTPWRPVWWPKDWGEEPAAS
ncbi:hypothetical protein ABBQ32_001895 [Trebouxia sp. C0010 RCD-2024]